MRINNCNCGRKIHCGCGTLSFDSYQTGLPSLLNVGNLVSSEGCILDEYVIDWYKDDVLELTTGIGSDPDIDAVHPLTGNSAVPVPPGLYSPVIRYIVVDGKELRVKPATCKNWCEVEIDLPEVITVETLNCFNGNLPSNNAYDHSFVYQGRTEAVSEPRTIVFDMSGTSDPYLAFNFNAVLIPDQIDVYFNDTSNILTSRITGSTGLSTNYNVTPMRYSTTSGGWRFVLIIPEAVNGKREVIIKVTPSVLHPTVKETDWLLSLACLSEEQFNPMCNYFDNSFRELDFTDWYAVDNTALCRREFGIKLKKTPVINYSTTGSNPTRLNQYTGANRATTGFSLYDDNTHPYACTYLTYSKTNVAVSFLHTSRNSPLTMAGSMIYKKQGAVVSFVFTDLTDFLYVKDIYEQSLASPWGLNIGADPTKLSYYARWNFVWRSFSGGCLTDPLGNDMNLQIFHAWPVVFDQGNKTITINCGTITNQIVPVPCDPSYSTANTIVNVCNTYANLADFEHQTDCFYRMMFGTGYGYLDEPVVNTMRTNTGGYYHMFHYASVPCDFPFECKSTNIRGFLLYFIFIEINIALDPLTGDFPKDESGVYIKDPLKWFTVWNRLSPSTYCNTGSNLVKLLQVEDGIVTHTQQWNE